LIRQGSGENRQTLLFLRRKFPFLYTVPAGHIEQGGDPEAEMRREATEETGMIVQTTIRLWPDEVLIFEDPCRRGANYHRWHVFDVLAEGAPRLSDEGRIIGWYSDDEIRALAAARLLTAPVHQIFSRLGILRGGA
jgi:8-oxo-dGTP pyrophosphatase MutT (NUDIX family)